MSEGAVKHDQEKPRLELLPPSYWREVGSQKSKEMSSWYFYEKNLPSTTGHDAVPILEFGAFKYASHNWVKGMKWGRLVGAFHRHCNYFDAEKGLWLPRDLNEPDGESHLPHGAHAQCCLVFLTEYYEQWKSYGNLMGENDCVWNVNK